MLDQYYLAKAEVSEQSGSMFGVALGLAAVGAGFAADASIFGGAAKQIIENNPWLAGFSAGALILAAGTSFSESPKLKTAVRSVVMAASLGVAMVATDNDKFKEQFAHMLPHSISASVHEAAKDQAVADVHILAAREKPDRDIQTLRTGGVNGKPILADGYIGNDAQGRELEKATIPADEQTLQAAMEEKAGATLRSEVASANDPAKLWGQILGALYLSAWLIAAQTSITSVLDRVRRQNKDATFRIKKTMVKNLESSRGAAEGRVQVQKMLTCFHDVMVAACKTIPVEEKKIACHAKIDQLFSEGSFEKATDAGVELITPVLSRRKNRSLPASKL